MVFFQIWTVSMQNNTWIKFLYMYMYSKLSLNFSIYTAYLKKYTMLLHNSTDFVCTIFLVFGARTPH